MATKPTGDYDLIESWATSGTKTKPDSAQIASGWTTAQKPLSSIFNWNWDFAFKWFKYLVDKTDEHDNLSYLRTVQTQTAHGFNNDLVYCDSSGVWQKAIGSSLTTIATHFAVRIDDNNFYCYSNGEISSTGILDSGGSTLVEGSTYILSKTVSGKASTTVLTDGSIVQPCFKVNDGKIKFLFNSNSIIENQKIDKSGGTFTGNIIIPDATLVGHAVNKGQFDNFINNFQGYINGLIMSNNTFDSNNDIDISTGIAMDSINSAIMKLSSPVTKRLDANFVAGTNQGGFIPITSHTAKENSSSYNAFVISNGTLTDMCFIHNAGCVSTNGDLLTAEGKTAVAAQTGWTESAITYRRIGSIRTDASGNIIQFTQSGDIFLYKTAIQDASIAASATASLITMTAPLGIITKPILQIGIPSNSFSGLHYVLLTSPQQIDSVPSITNFTLFQNDSYQQTSVSNIATNTSSQLRIRSTTTGATIVIVNAGYTDIRGKY